MKKSILLIALAALFLMFSGACSKKTNTTPNTMSCEINGVAVKSDTCFVFHGVQNATFWWELFGPNVHLIFSSVQTGTQDLWNWNPSGPISASAYPTGIDSSGMTTGQTIAYGTVNVTESDTRIVGTFSFTCVDSTRITNGLFNVAAK